ncbi:MAG: hypothetical protein NTU57_04700 [Candidatus Aenigmarchaeota archaeon]|nr:hypothetical protein [Candidatus Aenigmarchaeota archaeon]
MKKHDENKEMESHLKQYNIYAGNLRNWFVGYGIGALVLFITQKEFFSTLSLSEKNSILISIAIGIFLQIFISMWNKYTQWLSYQQIHRSLVNSKLHKIAGRITRVWQIDFICDALTLIAFAYALIVALKII